MLELANVVADFAPGLKRCHTLSFHMIQGARLPQEIEP